MMRRAPRERGERSSVTGSVRRARRYAACWGCPENLSGMLPDSPRDPRVMTVARDLSASRAADALRGGTAGSRSVRCAFRHAA